MKYKIELKGRYNGVMVGNLEIMTYTVTDQGIMKGVKATFKKHEYVKLIQIMIDDLIHEIDNTTYDDKFRGDVDKALVYLKRAFNSLSMAKRSIEKLPF